METNTPEMPSVPSGDPTGVTPVQDVQDNPVRHNSTMNHSTEINPTTDGASADDVGTLARPKGPNASAVVLGLAAIVLAGLLIADETMGLQIDWSRLGPGAIVGIGLVLVVLGAIGLVRRHDDL
jgi:hypothetical protein